MASGGSSTTSTTKGARTRQAILEAATARFARDGYRATSVADIARDAEVSGTLTYAYFSNKEALFLAALDEDAAAIINDGVASLIEAPRSGDWLLHLIGTVIEALDHHPLARRVLAGREPDVTGRVVELPALTELRKACAERISVEQREGSVRPEIDATAIGSGIVSIILSLLMSVSQIGPEATLAYGSDVTAVFAAALDPVT